MKTSIPKLHSIKWKDGALAENVIILDTYGPEDIPVDDVLKGAYNAGCYALVLFGYDRDGKEYVAGSMRNVKEAAYMFARGQLAMLRQADD